MRTSVLATLLLSGCFDYEALYHGTAKADLAAIADLAEKDLASANSGDLSEPDLATPIYWINTFTGGAGAKPLRGIGGAGGSILAVGDMGTCLLSTNGRIFSSQSTNSSTNFTAVWASSATNAWLVGNGGAKINQYDGTNFPAGSMIPGVNYTAVFGTTGTKIIAVGSDPNNAAQLNMMNKWMPQNHGYGANQNGMWGMPNGNRLWTVGEKTTGGYFDLGMNQWTTKQVIGAANPNITFRAVWGTSDTDVWAVGDQGNISHYTSGAFTQVPSSTVANLNAIWGFTASNIFAAGDTGTIVHYDGTSWQPWTNKKDITSAEQLLALWGDGTNLWAVSTQGNIFRYE